MNASPYKTWTNQYGSYLFDLSQNGSLGEKGRLLGVDDDVVEERLPRFVLVILQQIGHHFVGVPVFGIRQQKRDATGLLEATQQYR